MLFPLVNRSLIVVRPRQAFLDWANGLQDGPELTLDAVAHDASGYLVESIEEDRDFEDRIATYHSGIFENELFGWCTDQSRWPRERSIETFRDWFDVSCHSVVEDLARGVLTTEE